MRSSLKAGSRWFTFGAALFALNFALTFHNVWPTPWITTRHELSVEIAALLLVLILWEHHYRPISTRALHGLALLLTIMCVGRYAEVTAPALYGRRINLYWDAQYLPAVAAMLVEAANPWFVLTCAIGAVSLLVLVFLVLRWCLRRVHETVARPVPGGVVALACAGLLTAYLLGYTPVPVRVCSWFSLPVSTTYWRQAEFVYAAATGTDSLPAPISMAGSNLSRVRGSDVLVLFVESYGAIAYDNAAVAAQTAAQRASFTAAVRATQRRVVSAFVESPTFGGGSWLAHMSFFTGLDVRDQGVYNLLLTQQRDSLTSRFRDEGYRVLAVMPGLKSAWPEGAFYGFQTILGEDALDYPGPDFGWWRIPDQFSLARFASRELGPSDRAPVLAFFPTISTHMPFRPTPPFEPDWQRLLTDRPYDAAAAELAYLPEWTDLTPAYAGTLSYTFEYLSSFLHQPAPDDLVLVMLGDHQPPANVSGTEARWDVPVHIVSSDDRIIDALLEAGFVEGLTPPPAKLAPMSALPLFLLDAFSSPAADASFNYDVPR